MILISTRQESCFDAIRDQNFKSKRQDYKMIKNFEWDNMIIIPK